METVKLKSLTPQQCVKIATIAELNIVWKFIKSSNKWDEFDLIEQTCNIESEANSIFQIDYRSESSIGSLPRLRIYKNLEIL